MISNTDTALIKQRSDAAIVGKVFDPEIKQPIIMIAGLTPVGTRAAAEFVTNPQYLNSFLMTLPKGWETKNLEILLNVDVINAEPGPPRVVAVSMW